MTDNPQLDGTCPAVGALVIDGHRRGWLRCSLDAGHDRERSERSLCRCGGRHGANVATPHRAVFEWADDAALIDDWPELYDANEVPDVAVPLVAPGACLEPRPGDGAPCRAPLNHRGLHAWPVALFG